MANPLDDLWGDEYVIDDSDDDSYDVVRGANGMPYRKRPKTEPTSSVYDNLFAKTANPPQNNFAESMHSILGASFNPSGSSKKKKPRKSNDKKRKTSTKKESTKKDQPRPFQICYIGWRPLSDGVTEDTSFVLAPLKIMPLSSNLTTPPILPVDKYSHVHAAIRSVWLANTAPILRDKFGNNTEAQRAHYQEYNHLLEPYVGYHYLMVMDDKQAQDNEDHKADKEYKKKTCCNLFVLRVSHRAPTEYYNFEHYAISMPSINKPYRSVETFEQMRHEIEEICTINQ